MNVVGWYVIVALAMGVISNAYWAGHGERPRRSEAACLASLAEHAIALAAVLIWGFS